MITSSLVITLRFAARVKVRAARNKWWRNSVTRLGYFWKVLETIFPAIIDQISWNFFGHFRSVTIWIKYDVATFWENFGENLATFYSFIWSHCGERNSLLSSVSSSSTVYGCVCGCVGVWWRLCMGGSECVCAWHFFSWKKEEEKVGRWTTLNGAKLWRLAWLTTIRQPTFRHQNLK